MEKVDLVNLILEAQDLLQASMYRKVLKTIFFGPLTSLMP